MSGDDSTGNDLPPEVQSWLDEHPDADAETLGEVWQLSGEVPSAMDPDPERIDRMRHVLHEVTATDRLQTEDDPAEQACTTVRSADRSPTDQTRTRPRWAGWAAGTTVLVFLAASIYLFAITTRITVPAGQTQTVSLPDGTTVELNSGTTLRYPRWWRVDKLRSWLGRSVELKGEAFFSVAETGTLFHVETDNAEVRVLGTRFNVRARRPHGRPETRVVVARGRVALASAGATTHLDSAQAATVQEVAPPSPPETVRVDQQLAWRRGGFSFTNASVRAIAAEVARRYDVSIAVQPDVETRPVTLQVNNSHGPAPLLRDVCRAAGCRVDSTASGLVVRTHQSRS